MCRFVFFFVVFIGFSFEPLELMIRFSAVPVLGHAHYRRYIDDEVFPQATSIWV